MNKKRIFAFILLSAITLSGQAANHFSVFEDLLYWHASQQTTSDWAHQFSLVPTNNINFPLGQGTYFTESNLYFGWSPGLKVGIQYQPINFFDTKLYWTHFSTRTNDSTTAAPGQVILPEFFNGFTTANLYNTAQISWYLGMNMVDADIGHQFNPLDSLMIRPYLGIKGGSINQSIHSTWQMTILNIQLYNATENVTNNFSGIGPSFGFDSLWNLYKGLGIRSDFETALLWGQWNNKDAYHIPGSLLIPEKTITSNINSSLGAFMASYFIGFEWTVPVKTSMTLRAGYEMQFWSNQLRLPVFQALPIHGDLTLQGGTCGIYINL